MTAPSSFADLTVLVVDDHSIQRRVVVKRLADIGVTKTLEAGDGAEAMSMLETHGADVVLCDLDMPHVDGLRFVRELVDSTHDVAIAFMSAVDRAILDCVELMTQKRAIRFLGAIEKPVSTAQIRTLLEASQKTNSTRCAPAVRPLEEIRAGFSAGEFQPYFQPIVDAKTGQLKSAEALARWHHPVDGVLSPATFLPALEESDNTNALTWMVLDGSLKFVSALAEHGLDIKVSVNLSAGFLSRPGVADVIAEQVADAGVRASQISFEVTEGMALTTVLDCLENLARLRLRGHILAADDFGTAFASLRQLIRVPFQVMKFDRTFLRDGMNHERAWTVLRSTVAMARALDMTTVIEGVETEEERARLATIGADLHQGYFYGRPIPAEAFIDQLAEWIRPRFARAPSRYPASVAYQ